MVGKPIKLLKDSQYITHGDAKIYWTYNNIRIKEPSGFIWRIHWSPVKIQDYAGNMVDFKTQNALFTLQDRTKLLITTSKKLEIKNIYLFPSGTPLNEENLKDIDTAKTTIYCNFCYKCLRKAAGPLLSDYLNSTAEADQNSQAEIVQYQDVSQINNNSQYLAFSFAVGQGSFANAEQLSFQSNSNAQFGIAGAFNTSNCTDNKENKPLNNPRKEADSNQIAVQGASIAFSVNGGEAISKQNYALKNLDTNCKEDDDINLNSKKINKSNLTNAYAKTEKGEKAVLVLDKGNAKLKIQFHENGELLLNSRKINSVKKNEEEL